MFSITEPCPTAINSPEPHITIELTRGKVALIDVKDWPLVSKYKWCAFRNGIRWYAMASTPGNNIKKMYLHRLLLDAPSGMVVDHINGDGLDNRRSNIRLCAQWQNVCNQVNRKKSKTGYRGVYQTGNRFASSITANKVLHRLGSFASAEDAARAYDRAAIELHGEFAALNFPDAEAESPSPQLNTCRIGGAQ